MVYSFLCLCPLRVAIMLNFNIPKGLKSYAWTSAQHEFDLKSQV